MQRKSGWRDRLVSLLELPGDVMLDVARITLVGDRELAVENHRGIHEYTPDQVLLSIPEGTLQIQGEALSIRTLTPDQVLIAGLIRRLALVPAGTTGGGS